MAKFASSNTHTFYGAHITLCKIRLTHFGHLRQFETNIK